MLFHICAAADWHEALRRGEYHADSLGTEGFIHASTEAQVVKTANRFYRGREGLVLLAIDPSLLTVEVRYEAVHEDLFPHVYGPVNLDAVTVIVPFVPTADGTFHLPPGP